MCVRPTGRDGSSIKVLLFSKFIHTLAPTLAFVGRPLICKMATYPRTLHETLLVQSNQISICPRHYSPFTSAYASNMSRRTCCHEDCLRPTQYGKVHHVPNCAVKHQDAPGE